MGGIPCECLGVGGIVCVCVCVYAHTYAVGLFDVLVLVHFKGEADENSTE